MFFACYKDATNSCKGVARRFRGLNSQRKSMSVFIFFHKTVTTGFHFETFQGEGGGGKIMYAK